MIQILQTCKKTYTFKLKKKLKKTSGKDDFNCALSNLQHQDKKLQQIMIHL
jgi:hypothetical protein